MSVKGTHGKSKTWYRNTTKALARKPPEVYFNSMQQYWGVRWYSRHEGFQYQGKFKSEEQANEWVQENLKVVD